MILQRCSSSVDTPSSSCGPQPSPLAMGQASSPKVVGSLARSGVLKCVPPKPNDTEGAGLEPREIEGSVARSRP